MDERKGELAASTIGDVAEMRMTLKIWDVPPELGRKFIGLAKASYANKSWLLLQDLMGKAQKYEEMVSAGKIEDHEMRIHAIEEFIRGMEEEAQKEMERTDKEGETKMPKTFGGDSDA